MAVELFKARCSRVADLLGDKGFGKTGESYVQDYLTEKWCGYRKDFSNKYTRKGLEMEPEGIDLVARVYDLGMLMKNPDRRDNGKLTGECDIWRPGAKQIRDIKCSWNAYTFPKWESICTNKVYISQANGYMDLWDIDDYKLDYCLVDASEKQIVSEYWKAHRIADIDGDEVNGDLYDEVRSKMIHSHLPEEQRVKTFSIHRNENLLTLIDTRIDLAREYQKSLLNLPNTYK